MQGQIRWKRGDYIKLGKAVAHFNKVKNEVVKLDNTIEKFLPDTQEYSTLKKQIKTRPELNRVINSLKSFSKENSNLLKLEGRSANNTVGIWEFTKFKKTSYKVFK